MGKGIQTPPEEIYKVYEKMLIITNRHRNENQNQNKVSPNIHLDDYWQNIPKYHVLRMWRN